MDACYKIVRKNLILSIGPELDHHEANKLRQISDEQLRRSRARNIILDFSVTVFMDSAGVGMIIGRYKEANLRGGRVCVVNAGRPIRKLMEISGLYKLVYEYDSLDEALDNL